MTTNDFIQQCENSGRFHWSQTEEIYKGFKDGLTMEQVKVYANPEFEWTQMCEIRLGLEGLTMEQVKVYAKLEFNDRQMIAIRIGFEHGLTIKQVEVYAKPDFSWEQMAEICAGFEMGLTMEQVKVYAKPELDWQQMKEIRHFIKKNKDMSINTIKFLIGLDLYKKGY